ncbi:MAG: radical SAM protein [Thermoplasmata archaeon]|nr:radical SAM protein [Thermoplasmata archaeon]
MLKVHSIFKSIQGEGLLTGLPTVFVRLVGCPLRCKWCDTVDARSSAGKKMSIDDVVKEIADSKLRYVCITGGEPLAQDETITLMNRLMDQGYFIQLETSGALNLEEVPCSENVMISMDIKCPSSGEHEKMDFSNIELLSQFDQLKFVIANNTDYEYAKKIMRDNEINASIIMTPVGGIDLKELAEHVLKDRLQVRVMPQLHKLIWGDESDR